MPKGSTFRILIADDLLAMRALVRSSLVHIGYRNITECSDGEEALQEFTARPADLIISDLNMPKLDGLGLLAAVRKMPGRETTPFIMLTSRGEVNLVVQAKELKVNNYLMKPFNLVTLKKKIEDVVGPLT
jgi:two-component system, chemotaxis family, chemotaxis protein CheY